MDASPLDYHGARVLECIGGYAPQGMRTGLANAATFYLARSDHGSREFSEEEDYWVAAAEWLDSLGVRLANTSLGYTDEFDTTGQNHTPSQMDGHTTLISRAATIAATQKGMILVVAAGNEGGGKWRIVAAPGDCPDVITVGAVNDEMRRASYSSIGNPDAAFLKPDVVAWSDDGTSFSSPTLCGLVACMLQRKPALKPTEALSLLRQSGTLWPYGNNYVGYGYPQAPRLLDLLDGKKPQLVPATTVQGAHTKIAFSAPVPTDQPIILLHKDSRGMVIEQEVKLGTNRAQVKVDRLQHCAPPPYTPGLQPVK